MKLVQGDHQRHAQPILAIFNEAILHTTALYDYKPRTLETMERWFETKAAGNYPVLGVENESGELMGFASYGVFRAFPAYKYSVEHSVYVDTRFRRRGVGRLLLENLILAARRQDYHVLIGAIDSTNQASIALHEGLGFKLCGTLNQVGFKFSRWLDLELYQLILSTPDLPVDG